MRLVAACVLASIAGCGDRECTLQAEVDAVLAGETPMSCGELYSEYTPPVDLSAWSAAHDCVVTAATARTPFRVSWSRVLLEGLEDGVLVGGDARCGGRMDPRRVRAAAWRHGPPRSAFARGRNPG